jgi:hypothetical protein
MPHCVDETVAEISGDAEHYEDDNDDLSTK